MKIGAKMATIQEKIVKTLKIGPKNVVFSKRAQDFELLKQVPESSHQTVFLAGTNILGH